MQKINFVLEFFRIKELRMTGIKNRLYINDSSLYKISNKSRNKIFNFYCNDNLEPIDCIFNPKLYDLISSNDFAQYFPKTKELIKAGNEDYKIVYDLVYLLEILLDTFTYENTHQEINARLKLFSLKNLINYPSMNYLNYVASDKFRTELFKSFLFFHPTSEDYIDKFNLRKGKIQYQELEITSKIIEHLLDDLALYYRSDSKNIDFTSSLLKNIFKSINQENQMEVFLGIDLPLEDLLKINKDVNNFFYLYENDIELFHKILKEALNSINIGKPESSNSLYLISNEYQYIGNHFKTKTKKIYLYETFLDTYIFYISTNSTYLLKSIDFYSSDLDSQQKLLSIVFSHPFYTYNSSAKQDLIDSNLDYLIPIGFWSNKIEKWRKLMSR